MSPRAWSKCCRTSGAIRYRNAAIPGTSSGVSILDGAAYLGGAAALIVVGASVRNGYKRTFGRRRERYGRLARLGTGAHLSFFVSVLGEPPAIRHTIQKEDSEAYITSDDARIDPRAASPHVVLETRSYTESIFVDRDYYVQAISDQDDTVLAFSLTTRTRRFRPAYTLPSRPSWRDRRRLKREFNYRCAPLLRITLGRSRLADDDSTDPAQFAGPHLKVLVGAHNWAYSDFRSFGNPGFYQTFVLTASDVAARHPVGQILEVQREIGGNEWPDPDRTKYLAQPAWADHLNAIETSYRECRLEPEPRVAPAKFAAGSTAAGSTSTRIANGRMPAHALVLPRSAPAQRFLDRSRMEASAATIGPTNTSEPVR